MDGFFQKDTSGTRYAISRRDGQPFGVAGYEKIGAIR
jgi:putative SOS response-associated peptidase YedK